MNEIKIFKALSNETRLQILTWLKDPTHHFADQLAEYNKSCASPEEVGVCVGLIQQKSGLSQSTISQYLTMLQEAGLISVTRIGQWTYYKRNHKSLSDLARFINKDL